MTDRSRDDLLKEIAELKEANEVLLNGHARMTVAYLALRFSKLEERVDELSQELPQRVLNVDKRVDEFGVVCRELKSRLKELEK